MTGSGLPENLKNLSRQRIAVDIDNTIWKLERIGDIESLWENMTDYDMDEDERIPYWVELWPAGILLAKWLSRQEQSIQGKLCLDLGCGLGLTACVASGRGAKVIAMDYEWPALFFSRLNAGLNKVPPPFWTQMDWRNPAIKNQAFDFIWGGDILYEKRFMQPVSTMMREALAPNGKIWVADPRREVSGVIWEYLHAQGWKIQKVYSETIHWQNKGMNVNLWEMSLQ